MTKIWIPGRGDYDMRAWKVDRVVREYNDRLMFGRNEDTGDWCVFIEVPRPDPPVPVLGFGTEIPEPEEALKRLYKADTARHGMKIYDEIVKSQEEYKERYRKASDEASEETSEVLEHFLRKRGKSPVVKVFMS
jgi:hypothetical protein